MKLPLTYNGKKLGLYRKPHKKELLHDLAVEIGNLLVQQSAQIKELTSEIARLKDEQQVRDINRKLQTNQMLFAVKELR